MGADGVNTGREFPTSSGVRFPEIAGGGVARRSLLTGDNSLRVSAGGSVAKLVQKPGADNEGRDGEGGDVRSLAVLGKTTTTLSFLERVVGSA
jgi:hypothetical protein